MSQVRAYYVCSLCHREVLDHPPSNHVIGLGLCYFCGEKFTTLHVHEFKFQAFSPGGEDELIIFTKIDFGLHMLYKDFDESSVCFFEPEDYHEIPPKFATTLRDVGFIGV